ncbi:MAG: tetratricopeptide repeat protein [Candidatus Omnitrophota bacterium]
MTMKKIFISYSHEDTNFKEMLVKQLKVLELEDNCSIWEDSQIAMGTDWLPEIQKAINDAQIAVLMVSAGFLTSNFIRGKEVPPILERRKNKGLIVLPLFVKPCPWKTVSWLSSIQGFPLGKKALSQYPLQNRLGLLTQFAESIHNILKPEEDKNNLIPLSGLVSSNEKTELFTSLPARKIHLIGREKDLAALEDTMKTSRRVVLVNGMGGIGKTEVCKAFFLEHYRRYRYAAWVDWISSVKESIVKALGSDKSKFIQANETDTDDERFEKIKERLNQINESFLLVLDNIENPEDENLELFCALPEEINILANSRSIIEGYDSRSLDFLSPSDCKELFIEFYKGKRDDDLVEKIVALSGYHTLTIELLAKTASNAAMSLGDLYQTLQSKGFNLNAVRGETVFMAWHDEKEKRRFFDHLVKVFELSGVTKKELKVLVNLSVLPSIYIPIAWIAEWFKLKDNNGIVSLIEKGWLKRDEEARIYMHPVIQEVVKYKTRPDAKKCRELIVSLMWKLKTEPGDNPIDKKEFLIYGESVVRGMGKADKDPELATLANNLSLRYMDMGEFSRALEFQLKAVEIDEAVLGSQHPLLATLYNNISTIYKDMGEFSRALEFQLKAVEIDEAVLDPQHPDLATSYNNVSMIYKDMGEFDRALEFQLKALEIKEAVLEPQHPSLATSYNNISMIYQDMGKFGRALEFQLKDIKISEKILSPQHPSLATSYNNVSTIYRDMGKWDDALFFSEKAVAILQFNFPNGHPDLTLYKKNLDIINQEKPQ